MDSTPPVCISTRERDETRERGMSTRSAKRKHPSAAKAAGGDEHGAGGKKKARKGSSGRMRPGHLGAFADFQSVKRAQVEVGKKKTLARRVDAAPLAKADHTVKNLFRVRSTAPPVSIFEKVGYTYGKGAVGEKSLLEKAAKWVERNCEIPEDFHRPIHFGPLSGSSLPERLVDSFRRDLLKTKSGNISIPSNWRARVKNLLKRGFGRHEVESMLCATGGDESAALSLLTE